MSRFFLLIIDGFGIGAQEDAYKYGDEEANTAGHVCSATNCKLPNFQKLGLGNIADLKSVPPAEKPLASWGKMREISAGKDSTTGHWELAGIQMKKPFPTYPNGFPEQVIDSFLSETGNKGVLCNKPYSGTNVIADYGEEHLTTGHPIVYTSADSVFQVACHVDVTDIKKLYEWCEAARNHVMINAHAVGRVIARPFQGKAGNFERISDKRHDFSLQAPEPNLMTELLKQGIKTYSIGKIIDLFAGEGFTQYRRTKNNDEGISQLLSQMSAKIDNSFTFVNLIDTDQIYGHRQDPAGYAKCLQNIDRSLPAILSKLGKDDYLLITGDHGNDPTDDSTDHTREFVPLLAVSGHERKSKSLGVRTSFSDVAATILHSFGLKQEIPGTSFYNSIK